MIYLIAWLLVIALGLIGALPVFTGTMVPFSFVCLQVLLIILAVLAMRKSRKQANARI